jgi:hypothetical protein
VEIDSYKSGELYPYASDFSIPLPGFSFRNDFSIYQPSRAL